MKIRKLIQITIVDTTTTYSLNSYANAVNCKKNIKITHNLMIIQFFLCDSSKMCHMILFFFIHL